MVKVLAYWEFTDRLDAILAKPYFLRIVKTVNYMLYLIHLNACAYYAMSEWEGVGTNAFVYDGEGSAYIRYDLGRFRLAFLSRDFSADLCRENDTEE